MLPSKCVLCANEATLFCNGCETVGYCCKQHRDDDWDGVHKEQCKCYEIKMSDVMGRYAVAKRDIKQGEIILEEMPLIIGPKMISSAICLGCHKTLTFSRESRSKEFYKCRKCHWPLCGPECEASPWHQSECRLFNQTRYSCNIKYSEEGKKESSYAIMLPLRIVQLKGTNANLYKKIMTFESHLEQRAKTHLYAVLRQNMVRFIKMLLGNEFADAETIMTVQGILDTNTFDIRVPNGTVNARGLYFEAAMLSHDCHPNVRHLFRPNMQIVMFATRDIAKGETISISYTQPLKSTVQRREHLLEAKCFLCMCRRCRDPTEFGLFLNSLLCPKCRKGRLVPVCTTTLFSDFECLSCKEEFSASEIKEMKEKLTESIQNASKNSPNDLEELLKDFKNVVHSTSSAVLEVKYALIQLYNQLPTLNKPQLERKTDLCMQLLEVGETLDPAFGVLRATLLKELADCLLERNLSRTSAKNEQYIRIIDEANQFQQLEMQYLQTTCRNGNEI